MYTSGNGSMLDTVGLAAPGLNELGRRLIELSVRKVLVRRKLKPVTFVLGRYQKLNVWGTVELIPLRICCIADTPTLPGPVATKCKLALPVCLTAVLTEDPAWFP